jgi:arylsulfotransferase ASST
MSRRMAAARAAAALGLVVGLAACADVETNTQPTILFSPIESTSVYLMGLDGQKLHEWTTGYAPGYSVYLLPDGTLLRATSIPERPLSTAQGSNGGRVELLDWNSAVRWRFDYATTSGQQHHDVFPMPNGHVLLLAWETRSAAEAIAAGRAPETLPAEGEIWVDKVVEVDPATSRVVWEWRTWDHLVPPGGAPADHPGLVDPSYNALPQVDWTHANAVFYDAGLDQVLISVRNFSEVWVVDHGTTTEEAAGHSGGRLGRGGDLVYRWGNPRVYGHVDVPQQIFGQHNAQWIASGLPGAGHLLLFDNGEAPTRPYSNVVEVDTGVRADRTYPYDPATGFGPAAALARYDPAERFFAPIISGAQRLVSGNTLVTDGPAGRFFEVTPEGRTVWSYQLTDTAGGVNHLVFRATRYEPGYAGLAGRELAPQGLIRVAPTATASLGARARPY